MKHFFRSKLALTLAALVMIAAAIAIPLSSSSVHTRAQGTVTITEFPYSVGSINEMTFSSDGNLWFTELSANKIGRITTSGTETTFSIPTTGSSPYGITFGPDGNLWFTEYFGNKIGRITPSGTITEYSISTSGAQLAFITSGPDGNLWFTEAGTYKIGRITPSGTITEFPTNYFTGAASITSGSDGNLWFSEPDANKIGRVTPSGTETEFSLPTGNSLPIHITSGPDGNLWFTEYYGNHIGRITPSGTITEFSIPTTNSGPRGITSGPDGNLWFTEPNRDQIGRITPNGNIVEFPVPTASAYPDAITTGPDGNIWFAEDVGKIGRVNLSSTTPTPSPSPSPPSTITVSPNSVPAGKPVTVTGTGWTPGHVVDILFNSSPTVLTKVIVASDGPFTGKFKTTLTVPSNTAQGTVVVFAKDETTASSASAPLMVTPAPSLSPGPITTTTDASCTSISQARVLISSLDSSSFISGRAKVVPDDSNDTGEATEGENLVLLETNGTVTKPIKVITIANGATSFSFTPSMSNDTFAACIQGADGDEQATITFIDTITAQDQAYAGYASVGSAAPPVTYTDVKGTWVVPNVICPSFNPLKFPIPTVAFWVGIGGEISLPGPFHNNKNKPLEQTGILVTCASKLPVYVAFYEMFPARPSIIFQIVNAGDIMKAEVSTSGNGSFTLTLQDVTRGWKFSPPPQTQMNAPLDSAECVAENPNTDLGGLLPDFGSVAFSNCSADNLPINAGPIILKHLLTDSSGNLTAEPLSLNPAGSGFRVKWIHN